MWRKRKREREIEKIQETVTDIRGVMRRKTSTKCKQNDEKKKINENIRWDVIAVTVIVYLFLTNKTPILEMFSNFLRIQPLRNHNIIVF